MRTRIRQALTSDAMLADLGLNTVVSGDADSVQARPFINLRWGDTTPGMGPVQRRNLVVWIHDEPGDYDRIDQITRRIRDVLTGMYGVITEQGSIVAIEWVTDSGDLSNETRRTILRTSTYQVVGSGV